ncbi:hypothetical protein [Methylobacterium soli]|uniref:Uncharacterized protein n=1 Tax=Methylobacterium soli TaxID=553447 RepID=A0A6L3T2R1_9HYPH|nr:hypothetical protein [Methylobacterium soli]KAB1079161.1 hypothetical protein F6X53_12395 [Methylobacterium soli]GJE43354.1 hypothetical protein AEGHOMDF_2533 [Methylobacterium soli]
MTVMISPAASQIIEAGIQAAQTCGGERDYSAADRAVERAIGQLSIAGDMSGRSDIISPLLEIAQLYVRNQIGNAT